MGTNGQADARARLRRSTREALLYGLAGMVFALVSVMLLRRADTWYLTLGAGFVALAAVAFVAKAIIALHTNNHASPE